MPADPAVSLVELIEQFGSEDACREYLEELRWPDGARCPRCDSKASRIRNRNQFDCNSCRYQFSVRSGTLFHDSKLPLWKWMLATYLMVESKKGFSANQMKRTLGVTYKTAWFLCHRIRACMEDDGDLLDGIVEVDETYVGGKARAGSKARGKGAGYRGNKTMVMGAVQRGGQVRLEVNSSKGVGKRQFHGFVDSVVDDTAEAIHTDEATGYHGIGDDNARHETVNHGDMEWVRCDVHTNSVESVWSLLKRSIVGTHHQLSTKHLDAYLGELAWRQNNRDNPYLFEDTLKALLVAPRLTYEELTQAQ